ncbi:MAG TPA: hypothetical protein VKY74_00550, partial [Chloroflexia bacterium]|nr:hypothetical protein [Chloroflexia bacterium]
HWDGQAWSRVPSPNPGPTGSRLAAITVLGSDDAWAVGSTGTARGPQTLVLHWNGRYWLQVPSPNGDLATQGLNAVAAAGPLDVWAAGDGLIARYASPCAQVANPVARVADPQDPAATYFAPTGHTLREPFRRYWQAQGGLAQFGYPLTEPFPEINPATDQLYTVQYFERARFEYHPENLGTPYAVLLGLLGRTITADRAGDPPFAARLQADAAGRWFPQTGHTLAPAFLAYWDQHGGLPVYGYPISEAFTEPSPTDGQPYLVQYFERNRLEYHPELPEPYRVSLGLLGTQLLQARGWLP